MSDARLDDFSAGKAIAVDARAIEKELASLWRSLAQAAQKGERKVTTRACLWNLIVRTPGGAAFTEAKQLIDEISPSLPAHVLVLALDTAGADAAVEATVEANWHAGGGGQKQIGSEEVTLRAGGSLVNELVPSLVRALVVSDVPTAAIWHGVSPTGDAVDVEMFAAANRAVLGGSGDEGALRAIAALATAEHSPVREGGDLTSLAWLRGTSWRQMLASLFDPPTPVQELSTVDGVTIGCREESTGAALLYLGWLGTRLGWHSARKAGVRIYQMDSPAGVITARIEPPASSENADDLFARVELTTPSGPFAITRIERGVALETPEIARKTPRHIPSDSDLWLHSLGARGHDPLFLASLKWIAPLLK